MGIDRIPNADPPLVYLHPVLRLPNWYTSMCIASSSGNAAEYLIS